MESKLAVYDITYPLLIQKINSVETEKAFYNLALYGAYLFYPVGTNGIYIYDLFVLPELGVWSHFDEPSRWVSVNGNKMVTTSRNRTEFKLWNIEDLSDPVLLSTVSNLQEKSVMNESLIITYGRYNQGLQIYSNPTSGDPQLLAEIGASDEEEVYDVCLIEDKLWTIAENSSGDNKLRIYDLNDPDNPQLVNETDVLSPQNVVARGNNLFITHSEETFLSCYSVGDDYKPDMQYQLGEPEMTDNCATWGNNLFVADDLYIYWYKKKDAGTHIHHKIRNSDFPWRHYINGIYAAENALYVLTSQKKLYYADLSDEDNIRSKGNIGLSSSEVRIVPRGDYVYLTTNEMQSRFRIIDFSDAQNPAMTYELIHNFWDIEAPHGSDLVFLSFNDKYNNMEKGLLALDVSDPSQPQIVKTIELPTAFAEICSAGGYLFAGVQNHAPGNPHIVAFEYDENDLAEVASVEIETGYIHDVFTTEDMVGAARGEKSAILHQFTGLSAKTSKKDDPQSETFNTVPWIALVKNFRRALYMGVIDEMGRFDGEIIASTADNGYPYEFENKGDGLRKYKITRKSADNVLLDMSVAPPAAAKAGCTAAPPGITRHDDESTVRITATAKGNWKFKVWKGSHHSANNPDNIILNNGYSKYSVTAVFEPKTDIPELNLSLGGAKAHKCYTCSADDPVFISTVALEANEVEDWDVHSILFDCEGKADNVRMASLWVGAYPNLTEKLDETEYDDVLGMNFNIGKTIKAGQSLTLSVMYEFEPDKMVCPNEDLARYNINTNVTKLAAEPKESDEFIKNPMEDISALGVELFCIEREYFNNKYYYPDFMNSQIMANAGDENRKIISFCPGTYKQGATGNVEDFWENITLRTIEGAGENARLDFSFLSHFTVHRINNMTIQNVDFISGEEIAEKLFRTSSIYNSRIENCRFVNFEMVFMFNSIEDYPVSLVVSGCRFSGNNFANVGQLFGQLPVSCGSVVIENNIFAMPDKPETVYTAVEGAFYNCSISGNTFSHDGGGKNHIAISSSGWGTTISENNINGFWKGIYLGNASDAFRNNANNLLKYNKITSCVTGIDLSSDCVKNSIIANKIEKCEENCINSGYSHDTKIALNELSECDIGSAAGKKDDPQSGEYKGGVATGNNSIINKNEIHSNQTAGIVAYGMADPEIHYNNFYMNTFAVDNKTSSKQLDARHNYWGAEDGPGVDGGGSGDAFDGDVEYVPFTDEMYPYAAASPADTVFVRENTSDSVNFYCVNWRGEMTEISWGLSQSEEWGIDSFGKLMLTPENPLFVKYIYTAPEVESAEETVNRVRIKIDAIEMTSTMPEDSALVYLVAYQPELKYAAVYPDTAFVRQGDSARFAAMAFDQHGRSIAADPEWAWQDENGNIDSETGMFHANAEPGTYTILCSAGEIAASAYAVVIDSTVSVSEYPAMHEAEIYPNPSGGQINISLGKELQSHSTLIFIDARGNIIYQQALAPGKIKYSIRPPHLPRGFYFIKIRGKSEIFWGKVIIQK
jgi:plastocyanin